jgi:hypothetical protein
MVRIPIVPATYSKIYPATIPTFIRSQNRSRTRPLDDGFPIGLTFSSHSDIGLVKVV